MLLKLIINSVVVVRRNSIENHFIASAINARAMEEESSAPTSPVVCPNLALSPLSPLFSPAFPRLPFFVLPQHTLRALDT